VAIDRHLAAVFGAARPRTLLFESFAFSWGEAIRCSSVLITVAVILDTTSRTPSIQEHRLEHVTWLCGSCDVLCDVSRREFLFSR